METYDIDNFDEQFDCAALAQAVKVAEDGDKKPHGVHEVAIRFMGVQKSKAGKPMAKIVFEVVGNGSPYKGTNIYKYHVLEKSTQIHFLNEFLRSLKPDIPVLFEKYGQYNQLLLDIKNKCDAESWTFQLRYEPEPKNTNFDRFTIEDKFEPYPF